MGVIFFVGAYKSSTTLYKDIRSSSIHIKLSTVGTTIWCSACVEYFNKHLVNWNHNRWNCCLPKWRPNLISSLLHYNSYRYTIRWPQSQCVCDPRCEALTLALEDLVSVSALETVAYSHAMVIFISHLKYWWTLYNSLVLMEWILILVAGYSWGSLVGSMLTVSACGNVTIISLPL